MSRSRTAGRFDRRLLAGERAGPREDMGGVSGYQRACYLLAYGAAEDNEDGHQFLRWLKKWDPDAFNLKTTRRRFDR